MQQVHCDVEEMQLLLDYGADPYYINETNNETPLFITAKRGCVAATRMLLNINTNNPHINLPNKENKTPLMASIEARIKGSGALQQLDRHTPLLVEEFNWIEELSAPDNETPINIEVHIEIIHLLLNAGADPDSIDQDDFTPLMTAAIAGDIEIVRLLLAHGADPDHTNYLGYSALRYANMNGDEEIACLIRQALGEIEECQDQ